MNFSMDIRGGEGSRKGRALLVYQVVFSMVAHFG